MTLTTLFSELNLNKSFAYKPTFSQLLISGPDALSFLQKMSTNDLSQLATDQSLSTVFITHQGKIIDFTHVFCLKKDSFLLLSHHNQEFLYDWLEKYHFIEDFSITKTNAFEPSVIISCGQTPNNALKLFGDANLVAYLSINNQDNYELISEQVWQALRIAFLYPQAPNEINEHYMPQNIGLEHYISLNKGCFIGQEVIAKAITYQKNPFILVGLYNEPEKDFLGIITSKSPIFDANHINILAIVKKVLI
jgi:folate-binding protein YgfZ